LSEEIWTFCLWLQCGHSQLIDFSHHAIWHMDCSLLFNKVAREEQEAAGAQSGWLFAVLCDAGKISPQLAGTAARIIKTSGWVDLNARGDPRAFRNGVERQDGPFHCMSAGDGIEDKTPAKTVG
jgi:hypothetical protein